MTRSLLLLLAVLAASPVAADDSGWKVTDPTDIQWRPSDSLPAGAVVTVLDGDPNAEGFFTMRIKMPDGYRVPAHSHSKQERVTVLSGQLNLGHGDVYDAAKTRAMTPGTYSSMQPGMTHFAYMTGETVLQLSTIGPWTITYVNPAEDPRNQKK